MEAPDDTPTPAGDIENAAAKPSDAGSWTVRDNREASRYELPVEGLVAFLEYQRRPHSIVLKHTEVPESLRGRGIGAVLAKSALEMARAEGLLPVVHCPFVKAYLEKHPELAQPLKR